MSRDPDLMTRLLRLMDLKKGIMAYDYDSLNLRHLDALRGEVLAKIEELTRPREEVNPDA